MSVEPGHNVRMNKTTSDPGSLAGAPEIERALEVTGLLLGSTGSVFELVVIGGAALNILGFISRPTKDVDVLGLRTAAPGTRVVKAHPLPTELTAAAERAASDLGLDAGWLNAGPADLLDRGLPEGLDSRLVTRRYGPRLLVCLPDRVDLICLKVYAAADSGVGRHTDDLRALGATCDELLRGATWARTHDPSPEFCRLLRALLRHFGCETAAEALERECNAPQ
jgi:hypothetical protein